MTTALKSSEKLKKDKQRPEFIDSILDTMKQNGGMFTIFAVVLIFVSGITLIDNPQNWWVSALAITAFFVTVFLYMNARVFIKIALTSIITLFIASSAFSVGSYADTRGTGGLVWMCAVLFLFFSCLSISYLVSSGKSRWGSIMSTQIMTFTTTYILSVGLNNVNLGTGLGTLIGFAIFTITYKFSAASRFSRKGMPANTLTEGFVSSVLTGADESSMNSVVLYNKDISQGSVLVWRDKAYLLYPIVMDSGFTAIGRKSNKLGYKKKNINPWLINLAFTETPVWRSHGANIITVLVDLQEKNGKDPKVIGVTLPDTKRKLPVGVLPGKIFNSKNPERLQLALEQIEDEFRDYVKPLTEKQTASLSKIGVSTEIEED